MNEILILVVEGNGATRSRMQLTLETAGYTVLEAADGESALRLTSEHAPALVLLDCALRDMNGFEAVRRLRALSPTLPVIAVTGWAHLDEARLLTAGFLDVLVRPIESARLIEIVERHLGETPPHSAHSGKLILLVDDDATQRKLAQIVLRGAGFEVHLAETGEAALRFAATRVPDIIVSDVLMPQMDGFELCKAVRQNPMLATVPVVLMSAHFLESGDRELATRFGATRYVTRTAGFKTVVQAIIDALDSPLGEFNQLAADDFQGEYLHRIAHQLERQASIGVGLARRVSLQASALLLLESLSDSLAQQRDPESALGDTLSKCLEAAGLSVGAILLRSDDGQLVLKAHVGAKAELAWEKYSEILLRAVSGGGLEMPSADAGVAGNELLHAIGAGSALIVPIIARDEPLGALLLASSSNDLGGMESESAMRAARSVATQLGQALALSRMFSKLAAAEERYRSLLENARDAITVLTPEGVILEANLSCEKLFGTPRAQLVNRRMADFTPQDEREPRIVEYPTMVAPGVAAFSSTAIQRADGTVVNVEVSRTAIDVGKEHYVLSVARDVTDRLRLEEQLRQSQKMDAIGRLAGGVAHDFNNLLSVILSYGELVLGDLKPGEPMRDDIEEIRKAAKRAAELTRQLLMFSRQQVIEPKVLDLNEVLSGVDKMLQRIVGADIDLVSLTASRLGRVRVDPGSIEQVIMNLVVNARDAMPRGGKLTMETANVVLDEEYARSHLGVTAGWHVMLAVTDTGTGMDRLTQRRIFEPFYTTKGQGKGTGLGLSTVFGIVQQSGGSIWVYSELGKGTSFKVYLPRVEADLESIPPAQLPLMCVGSETILLVEDDNQVRLVASNILRRSGYLVLQARNAGEAQLLAENLSVPIHLLLTDVVMPGVSGPELAKRLTDARPEMKVLCMSGYTDDSILRHGVLESNMAYIQKPLTPSVLTTRVRETLDGSRSERSL